MKNVAQTAVQFASTSDGKNKEAGLRRQVAWVVTWLILAGSSQAGYVPYDPNTVNQYGVSAYGFVSPTTTPNSFAGISSPSNSIPVNYEAITIPSLQGFNGVWTLWNLDTWETNPFDLIIKALNTSSGQIIDIGADFWAPIWYTQDSFRFVDKWSGTTLFGSYNIDNRELVISNGYNSLFTFNEVQGTIPSVPEPWMLYLMIPGLAWVYFMRKKNQKNK